MGYRAALIGALVMAISGAGAAAQTPRAAGTTPDPGGPVRAIPYREVKPIVDLLRKDLVPEPVTRTAAEAGWNEWILRHDRDIRARVTQGDEDSVINLALYGTTFTRLERVTERDLADMADGRAAPDALGQRLAALTIALASPGDDARLQFAAAVVTRRSIDPRTPEGQQALRRWLDEGITRVVAEYGRHAAITHDASADSNSRATLFSDRGLASDTTIFPAFGIEQTLDALKSKGFLAPGSVRQVGVVGPGLDVVDKREGYDFYPPQTLQPFAVIDSLRRLGLAAPDRVQLTTLDLSPRVNEHLESARTRAGAGTGYVIQLPRDEAPARWTPFLVAYWDSAGDKIGETVPAIAPADPGVRNRAIRVRPDVVDSIVPRELNIVVERLEGDGARFDLLVATNVLIYYDVFDQLLALANASAMLRPGGFLLTNTPVPLVAPVPIELLGYSEVGYTDRPEGDRFFWYRKN